MTDGNLDITLPRRHFKSLNRRSVFAVQVNWRHQSKITVALVDRHFDDGLADLLDQAAGTTDDNLFRNDFQFTDKVFFI